MSFQTLWPLWREVPECYWRPSTGLNIHTVASHFGTVAYCKWNRIFSEITFQILPQPQRRLWRSSQYSTVQASRLNLWGALVCLTLKKVHAAQGLFILTLMRIFIQVWYNSWATPHLHYAWMSNWEPYKMCLQWFSATSFKLKCEKTSDFEFCLFKVSGTQLDPCSHYMERVVTLRAAVLWRESGIRSWQVIEVLFRIMLTVSTSWIHHTWPHFVKCGNIRLLPSSTTYNK